MFMPQSPCKLLRQRIVQRVDQIADMVSHVSEVQILPPAITGKDYLFQIFDNIDDSCQIRQRAMAQMVYLAKRLVSLDDSGRQIGEFVFAAEVGRHY